MNSSKGAPIVIKLRQHIPGFNHILLHFAPHVKNWAVLTGTQNVLVITSLTALALSPKTMELDLQLVMIIQLDN
jgi:hypothetical protein